MNAGMFNDAGAPIGLYVAEGEQQQRLEPHRWPRQFSHEAQRRVLAGRKQRRACRHCRGITPPHRAPRAGRRNPARCSSSTALCIRAFQHDGPSRYIRNGVGVRDDTIRLLRHQRRASVSFGRFARFFRDELHCDDALFLDGSVSALWAPNLDRQDPSERLGPLAVVLARN